MDIYNVDLATARISTAKWFARFLALFVQFGLIYFAVMFVLEWFWLRHNGRDTIRGFTFKVFFWALFMSLSFSFRKPGQYQIVVDEAEISTKNFRSMSWLSSRTIRRSEVRTLIERPNGLLISRYNRVGTFFWGGIWIPKQLADYEYLKRLVFSWKVVDSI